jgi:hypothetical protein
MAEIDFGFTLYPTARGAGRDVASLMDYNRRCIRALPPRFTTVWVEDHFQWGEIATLEGCGSRFCKRVAENEKRW